MKFEEILLFILCLILIYNLSQDCNSKQTEYMINVIPIKDTAKWKRNPKCEYIMSKSITEVVGTDNFEDIDEDDWDVYFPCTYNEIQDEIDLIDSNNDNQRMFIIDNADELSSKDSIWQNIVNKFGYEKAATIMPKTYDLGSNDEIEKFKNEYNTDMIYILKKNIQRQEGLKITQDKNEILKGYDDDYVVVQELLQDPYIIDNRKINLRCYILIMCKDGETEGYVFSDGFMYYTKVPYKKGSLDHDVNVTTGYIDRAVYDKNPLTLKEFKQYLDTHHKEKPSDVLFKRIHNLLKDVILAATSKVCNDKYLDKSLTFQLFGTDIAVSDKLIPHLIEINKGPDLGYKDDRDKEVKYKLVEDVFKTVGLLHNVDNEFTQLV